MKFCKRAWLVSGGALSGALVLALSFGFPRTSAIAASGGLLWPPEVGKPYPDLEMVDQKGHAVRLSSFKGKVLLIEPVGMNCPACLSWSGTHRYGAFQGMMGQDNVSAIEEMFPRYAGGISLSDPRIIHLQLLLFNSSMMPTSADDAKAWAGHFQMHRSNQVVLAGSAPLLVPERHQASYNLVPGFQLVDKNFILQSDSTSDNPKTNLWTELLPMVPRLVQTFAMSVEEAYQSIPHRRTVFNSQEAKMDSAEAAYLTKLFDWMDQAIVAKQSIFKGADASSAYAGVWKSLQDLQPPAKLKRVQDLYAQAAKDEAAFLQVWQKMPVRSFNANHPLVNQASGRLIQGYNELMRLYPAEDQHNKDAFYDYPCALDFK